MCAQWRQGYNPSVVSSGLEKIRSQTPDGVSGFEGLQFQDYATVLLTSVEFRHQVPEFNKIHIIHQAISSAAQVGSLSPRLLLSQIAKLEFAYATQTQKTYILATDISVRLPVARATVKLAGNTITLTRAHNHKIRRDGFLRLGKALVNGNLPTDYSAVRIQCKGRSAEEAGIVALETIDLLRGIWNFGLLKGKGLLLQAGQPAPLNTIMLGPLHSLHFLNGRRVPDPFWYDPTYAGPISPRDLSAKWTNLRKFEESIRKNLSRSKSRSFLEQAFVRYVRALDESRHDIGFLKLWSLLEYLTQATSSEQTIKRCACLFKDEDFHRQILQHLKERRNVAVHQDNASNEIATRLVYQAKRYVEALLEFHLWHGCTFSNLDETIHSLDLPTEPAALKKRIKLLRIKMRLVQG